MSTFKENRIKIILERIGEAIEKELGSIDCRVKAIQILVPSSSEDLHTIFRYQSVSEIENFNTATNDFVQFVDVANNRHPTRSLFFLKYAEPFKYTSYNDLPKKLSIPILRYDDKLSGQCIEITGNELNNLEGGEKKVEEFWEEWQSALSKNNYGYSSLWSYIKIPIERDGRCPIVSAYIIFEGKLDFKVHKDANYKLLSILNKRIQDYLFGLILDLFKDSILSQATRAAISQVMARNSSHNIGSHVMNKLINGKTLKQLNLIELYSKKSKDQEFNYHSLIEIEHLREEAETYHQLAIFNNYVKCRMDYLSDITFGTPLMQTTKKVYDLFEELDKVRLLLENISGLTKFHYQIQFTFNGGKIDKSLSLALPNDILGCQALYNIIENVIRNTAKHSKGKSAVLTDAATGKKLILFTINIKEIDGKDVPAAVQCAECYEVEIFDNVPVETGDIDFKTEDESKDLKKYVEDYNKDHTIKISESTPVSNINYLVYNQNKKLNESILQDNNSLRASGLGLIEMEASASYLRKLDISNIESDAYSVDYNDAIFNKASNNLNIVKAFKVEDKNYLGYRFFMLRPAEVLVITDNFLDENKIEEWLKVGVKIISVNQFKKNVDESGCLKDVYNHQFFVCNENSVLNIAAKNKTSLPIRIINSKEIEKQLVIVDLNPLLNFLWRLWGKQINSIETIVFKEIDEQRKDDNHIIILDHFGDTDDDKLKWESFYKNKKVIQLEALSSLAQNKLPNFAKINRALSGYLSFIKDIDGSPLQLESSMIKECAFSKVLVIDERIQAASYVEDLKISKRQVYEKMNLIIPDNSEYNLGMDDFNEIFSIALLNHIFDTCTRMDTKQDFVLIHYSILERCFNGNSIVLKNYEPKNSVTIESFLKELSKKINVVITSGRGTPQNLPAEVRYINLSPVITAFVEIRSKYFINYLLHSSRKSNRI